MTLDIISNKDEFYIKKIMTQDNFIKENEVDLIKLNMREKGKQKTKYNTLCIYNIH